MDVDFLIILDKTVQRAVDKCLCLFKDFKEAPSLFFMHVIDSYHNGTGHLHNGLLYFDTPINVYVYTCSEH